MLKTTTIIAAIRREPAIAATKAELLGMLLRRVRKTVTTLQSDKNFRSNCQKFQKQNKVAITWVL